MEITLKRPLERLIKLGVSRGWHYYPPLNNLAPYVKKLAIKYLKTSQFRPPLPEKNLVDKKPYRSTASRRNGGKPFFLSESEADHLISELATDINDYGKYRPSKKFEKIKILSCYAHGDHADRLRKFIHSNYRHKQSTKSISTTKNHSLNGLIKRKKDKPAEVGNIKQIPYLFYKRNAAAIPFSFWSQNQSLLESHPETNKIRREISSFSMDEDVYWETFNFSIVIEDNAGRDCNELFNELKSLGCVYVLNRRKIEHYQIPLTAGWLFFTRSISSGILNYKAIKSIIFELSYRDLSAVKVFALGASGGQKKHKLLCIKTEQLYQINYANIGDIEKFFSDEIREIYV